MAREVEGRRAWAYGLISRAQKPPPRYGSPEWLALPEGPEKVAAVVLAAEAWATERENIEENLRVQLDAEWLAAKRREDEDYLAQRDQHRELWQDGRYQASDLIAEEIEREWREWMGGAA